MSREKMNNIVFHTNTETIRFQKGANSYLIAKKRDRQWILDADGSAPLSAVLTVAEAFHCSFECHYAVDSATCWNEMMKHFDPTFDPSMIMVRHKNMNRSAFLFATDFDMSDTICDENGKQLEADSVLLRQLSSIGNLDPDEVETDAQERSIDTLNDIWTDHVLKNAFVFGVDEDGTENVYRLEYDKKKNLTAVFFKKITEQLDK